MFYSMLDWLPHLRLRTLYFIEHICVAVDPELL